jgi:hypothetical protein
MDISVPRAAPDKYFVCDPNGYAFCFSQKEQLI